MKSFNELKKNLGREVSGMKKVKLAILGDSATQLLAKAIKSQGIETDINIEVYEADYNQIESEVVNPASGLYTFAPDFVLINYTSQKVKKTFYKKDTAGRSNFSEGFIQTLDGFYQTITSTLPAKVIVTNLAEINDSVFGNYAAKLDFSFPYQLRKFNYQLMELAQKNKNLFICDVAGLKSDLGSRFFFDNKMYVNADMAYSIDALPYISKSITDIINALFGFFKKCLILDLDNTLWGGVIGDDGIGNIQLGDLGVGKAFVELQQWALELKRRGIILAICSKNTDSIAREVFEKHPDMVLSMDDISVFAVNWDNKIDNIKQIQEILNIGFDSMVFLDDNPFERNMVKEKLPAITVPDLPEDPVEYLAFLRPLNLFETASYDENDTQRTRQYQDEAQRATLKKSFTDVNDYLASLEMQSEMKLPDSFTIPRVAQLTQRSNQFNLTTIRYTEEDINRMIQSSDYIPLTFNLEDKYGDNGLICVVILKKEENCLYIDTWIMSCRVLKRGMENFVLNQLVEIAKEHNFKQIEGEYIPTPKNGIVKDHYPDLGFRQMSDGKWVLDVENYEPKENFIKLNNQLNEHAERPDIGPGK